MILPRKREQFPALTRSQLISEILGRRGSIRLHRDQKGHNRCHFDDYDVWRWLEGTPQIPTSISDFEIEMARCRAYYAFRRTEKPDPSPRGMIRDPKKWDADIYRMTDRELQKELAKIQEAIFKHCFIDGRPRTIDDDRKLYAVLPEKVPVDARLDERTAFLEGTEEPGTGCAKFLRSHASCPGLCNLHQWGPCGTKLEEEPK